MTTRAHNVARPHHDRQKKVVVRVADVDPSPTTCGISPVHSHPLLQFQHLHGNRFVQRMLHDRHAQAVPPIQCKLAVSEPGDAYEREADAIAEAAVGPGAAPVAPIMHWFVAGAAPWQTRGRTAPSTLVARKAPHGGACPSAPSEEEAAQAEASGKGQGNGMEPEEETPLMAKSAGPAIAPVNMDRLEERLAQRRGGGEPLPTGARADLEARLGHTFGEVRVHTDGEAADLSRALAAEAFTTGTDLYFGSGRFDPHSLAGRRLLAHELVHVVQQRADPQPAGGTARLQRYSLNGFPRDKKAKMDQAIPIAKAKVAVCDDLGLIKRGLVIDTLDSTAYMYHPTLGQPEESLCGWTYPTASHILIGATAFDPGTCCKLESTLAHEASHVSFSTEGGARELEKDCFGCS